MLVAVVLVLSAAPVEKTRLSFVGISAGAGVTPETARSLSEYVQSQLAATGEYVVISSSDIEKMLGAERQKLLLGCSDTSETCMAELAGALNADRMCTGSVTRADDLVVLNLSLIDLKNAQVIARSFRKIEAGSGLGPVLEEIPALVYELVNQDPRLAGKDLAPERQFGGFLVGVLGAVDVLGFGLAAGAGAIPIAPGIVVEYSGKRFGLAVTVLPKADFGARVEARWYPFEVKNLFRPHVAAGTTALLSGISARAALGGTLKLGHFNAFLDLGYERFFNFKPSTYTENAVVAGLGVGWLF